MRPLAWLSLAGFDFLKDKCNSLLPKTHSFECNWCSSREAAELSFIMYKHERTWTRFQLPTSEECTQGQYKASACCYGAPTRIDECRSGDFIEEPQHDFISKIHLYSLFFSSEDETVGFYSSLNKVCVLVSAELLCLLLRCWSRIRPLFYSSVKLFSVKCFYFKILKSTVHERKKFDLVIYCNT